MQTAIATPASTVAPRAVGLAALERCKQIVDVEADPWARAWRDASRADKKMMLRVAALPEKWADMYSRWRALPTEAQTQIKERMRAMRRWLDGFVTAPEPAATVTKPKKAG